MAARRAARRPLSAARALVALALAAALAPLAAAQAPAPAAAAPSPGAAKPPAVFKIGGLVPLTGQKADTGKAVKAAVEMAVRDYAPTKLPGVDVQLEWADTQCQDVPALRAAAKLAQDNVDALIGDVCSGASLAATSVADRFQLPMISPASTSTALTNTGDYFFRTVPSDRYQGQYAARKLRETGAKRVLVVLSEGSYGESLAFSFIAAFTRDGGRTQIVRGLRNATVVTSEIERFKPDAIFIASNDNVGAGLLIKALQARKIYTKIFGGDSIMDPAVSAAAGKAATVGVRGSDVSFGSPEFVTAFKDYTKGKVPYVAKAAHAYDAAIALMEAYRGAASPKNGPQIAAQLPNVKFQGKSGPIAFDEYGDLKYDPDTSYATLEFKPDGSVRVLEV